MTGRLAAPLHQQENRSGYSKRRYDGAGETMDTRKLIAAIDAEISRLQQVKLLLSARTGHIKSSATAGTALPTKRRKLSAAARAKIAAAQRERWARFRKSAK